MTSAASARAFADGVLARVRQVQRDARPLILEGLATRGYRAVAVTELLCSGGGAGPASLATFD